MTYKARPYKVPNPDNSLLSWAVGWVEGAEEIGSDMTEHWARKIAAAMNAYQFRDEDEAIMKAAMALIIEAHTPHVQVADFLARLFALETAINVRAEAERPA